MNRYEIYVLDEDGKLHPTGIWERGYRLNEVERDLSKFIWKIEKPCTILITKLIPGVNDK